LWEVIVEIGEMHVVNFHNGMFDKDFTKCVTSYLI
jgi:hypothetical protein